MAKHRVSRAELDDALVAIIRSGEKLDAIYLEGDEWVIVTVDRFETRQAS
jgi:hypothetical protein